MSDALLLTKLYVPPVRPNIVLRPRLLERLNEGLSSDCKLTLLSAPAGFGKSTLVCDWLGSTKLPVAWVTLDERDKDPARFLIYLIAALQHVKPGIGLDLQAILESPQPLQIENILTLLINQLSIIEENFLVILDDYHAIDSVQVDHLLDFLIDHQPSQMHLVITTREDPDLPLARLRGRGNCIELRASDLRFSESETADFLNRIMKLNLSENDILALETRTEGWIAGLLMAALSLQGLPDTESFLESFTGSHRFVMDYLVEEVLRRQSEKIQTFLQKTSILERMCGSLCGAILQEPSVSSQCILEYLEHVNLFIVPQDNERHWYRYHHLFADLLLKRLGHSLSPEEIAGLNIRASDWYENNDMPLEAFRHAVAANDIERATRLIEGNKMPLHIRGTATMILDWLVALPASVLNAQPALWWKQAHMLLLNGQFTEVEDKLLATEAALAALYPSEDSMDEPARDLVGKIAAIRCNQAVGQQNATKILEQANIALQFLSPNNLDDRCSVIRDMGFAYLLQGNRPESRRTFTEALSIANRTGDVVEPLLATVGLAQIMILENQLFVADDLYKQILPKVTAYSILNAGVVYSGIALIYYQWNDLASAAKYGEQSLTLARQFSQIPNRLITGEVFLANLELARGNPANAMSLLTEAEQAARQQDFLHRIPDIIARKVLVLLYQGDLLAAEELAQQIDQPLIRSRVLMAQGNPSAALALLGQYRQQMQAKGWQDELLRTKALQALALQAIGDKQKTLECLNEALQMAELGGFIRLFVDLGEPMRLLLVEFKSLAKQEPAYHTQTQVAYVEKILAAFDPVEAGLGSKTKDAQSELIEPLSQRELEVLQLICQGLSNQEICRRLYLALDTVKGHNRRIFDKLDVHRRTEAIARASELNLF